MQKFYSIVLMATALLIGTNMQAATKVATWDDLRTALQAGGQVELSDDINLSYDASTFNSVWIGAKGTDGKASLTADAPTAVLDMAGHDITITANSAVAINAFVLTKGSLKITGNGTIEVTGTTGNPNHSTNVFFVFGADDANKVDPLTNPFSHLEIDENVTVKTKNGTVIAVDQLTAKHNALKKTEVVDKGYNTSGMAYGALVEVKGTLISEGADYSTKKCYGIKTNGLLGLPATDEDKKLAPYIHIYPSAVIKSDMRSGLAGSAAAYASGFAQWLIEGTCDGAVGAYISAGTVNINNATISSAAPTYEQPGNGGHANGSGSAIVVNSRDRYPGEIELTVSGDTKASATSGYAVQEIVSANDANTKVDKINIEGGSFEGGKEGALTVSEATASSTTTQVTVAGGNVTGAANIGTEKLADYLNAQGGTHATIVTDESGKTTLVISEGDAPDDVTDRAAMENAFDAWVAAGSDPDACPSIKLTGSGDLGALSKSIELKELEMNEMTAGTPSTPVAQKLTIPADVTLKVGRVVLGTAAQIVVEAGAKFIVTGDQGIVAPSESNIVLKATETAQALFLFKPEVTSNRHPKATVEVYTNCKQLESDPKKVYVYQRLTIPVMTGVKPSNNFSGTLFPGNTTFTSYAWQWNGSKWAAISAWSDLKPFVGYTFANNSNEGGVTYSFAGELVGNGDAEYDFPTGGYDYFGCSHVAPIYIDSLFKHFAANMEATVWIYNFDIHNYEAITTAETHSEFGDARPEIKPMEAFVLRLKGAQGKSEMNYASAIWGNPRFDALLGRPSQASHAPARRSTNSASNRALVKVVAENGYADKVTLVENNTYSAEFENGADASKFIFADGINLYATTEAGDLARVATDDLTGTLLSFRSGDSKEYTINFTNVLGEDYALRDNVTGQVIAIAEGATYTFMQEANTTVPARFEVIKSAKTPTTIDNVEENGKVSGIYTILGEYMGRDFTTLPAGIYIVNGVKVVK